MPAAADEPHDTPAPAEDTSEPRAGRFLTLDDVALELATSRAQVYALVRRKDLRAVKLGGRGQWRVQRADLESFIDRLYADTERFLDEHPFDDAGDDTVAAGGVD